MPAALSKKTRPSTTMRPAAGVISPARHCSVSVLPAPEGPNSTATPPPADHATSRSKPGTLQRDGDLEAIAHVALAPSRLAATITRQESAVRTPTSRSAVVLFARLHGGVDRQRHRRGLAGNVAGQHQRGAELAERPREGEHESGQDAVAGQRQRHLQRRPQLGAAQRVGRPLEVAIDRLERRLRRAHEQRQRHHRGRHHRRIPGERDAPAGQLVDRSAEPATPAEQHDEVVAGHGRRKHERQRRQQVDEPAAAKSPAREHVGQRDPDQPR